MASFLMTGGGTGGHVIPALAVARELEIRGHGVFFIGTSKGAESRLVPAAGYEIEFIEAGGLAGVGLARTLRTLAGLPGAVARSLAILARRRPAAVFSTGGYVAGPPVLAARLRGLPLAMLEADAAPGLVNRWMGRFASRAMLNFPEAAGAFPAGRAEVTGLPVREEFFHIPPKRGGPFTVLVTGGSRGARTLNRAAREAWPLIRQAGLEVRMLVQTGAEAHAEMAREFAQSGVGGEVVPFFDDMPRAFAAADLVVCRSGAGAVAELAAAAKPAILVPYPFAAHQHQLRNAASMARAGAALLVEDKDMTGGRLFRELEALMRGPRALEEMAKKAGALARPGAARRAAEILEGLAAKPVDSGPSNRNNTI